LLPIAIVVVVIGFAIGVGIAAIRHAYGGSPGVGAPSPAASQRLQNPSASPGVPKPVRS
jgi:hypothetical protein